MVPFLPVFLDGRGFRSYEIGEILAIVTATKIVGPSLWAYIADHSGKQVSIIRWGALAACLSFIALFFVNDFWPLSFVLALFSLFWNAVLPQLEVLAMRTVRRSAKIYARVRLWGSIGFIIIASLSGELLAAFSSEVFQIIGLIILLMLFLSTLQLKQPYTVKSGVQSEHGIKKKCLDRGFVLFFIAGILLQVSFGPFYNFFALYLRDLNYPGYAAGFYISLGVVAEIFIFIVAGSLYRYFGAIWLISFSLFITAIRWYLTGHYADSAMLLFIAQVFHAASFGLYHSASIQFLQSHFHANQQNRGQAIYIGGVYGVGGALGAYLAGILWQDGVGATLSYNVAAVLALFGVGLTLLMFKTK